MRRTRIQYSKPAVERGSSSRRGGSGYVPYSPGCSRDVLDFSDPLRRQEKRTSFFCDVCKQQVSSKAAFITHCNSAFHKEKEEAVNKMFSEHEWTCHTCEKPFPTKVALDQHCLMVRHQPMYRIEGISNQKEAAKNEGPNPKQDNSQEKKSLFSFGSLKPPYYCEVCQIDCMSNSNLESHCESWKHRAACDRQKEEENEERSCRDRGIAAKDEGNYVKSEDRRDEFQKNFSKDVMNPNDFFCDICDVHISCRENYLAHLNGKKHEKHVSGMKLPYCCLFCDIKFGTREDFSDHYKSPEHICKASRLTNASEAKMKVDDNGNGERKSKQSEKEREWKREMDRANRGMSRDTGRSSRDRDRGNRDRDRGSRDGERGGGERSRDMKTNRGRERTNDSYGMKKEGDSRSSSRDGRESKSGRQSRELELSPKRFTDKNASKFVHNDGASEERRPRRESRRSGQDVGSRSRTSISSEKKDKLSLSKVKKEEIERKIPEKGSKSKGSVENDEGRSVIEGERKIEIKNAVEEDGKEEVGDLREVLNKSINIVITKKVKNDSKEGEEKDSDDAEKGFEADLKKDEETILRHHKADLVLREKLLKEHTVEILKYKNAEEEYQRLYLEAEYLEKRLDLFKDGDTRKDNDATDLDRMHKAMRDIREELEIRDVMIQEKERYLIVLKNRIEERTKIIAKAEEDSLENYSESSIRKPFPFADSRHPEVATKTDGKPTVEKSDEDFNAQSGNEDGDLRDEIERERILKKLAPGMVGLDRAIQKRIVDALLTSEVPRSELLKPAVDSKEGARDANQHGLRASSGRAENYERTQDSRDSRGIPYEYLNAKTQTLEKSAKSKSGIGFKEARMPFNEDEASSERSDVYLPSRTIGSSATNRGQQLRKGAADAYGPVDVDYLEKEWRRKDEELRKREEELRKRELELLEKQKYRDERQEVEESASSDEAEERSSARSSPNRAITPRKHGKEPLDKSNQRIEKEPEQQSRRLDDRSQKNTSLRRNSPQRKDSPRRMPAREGPFRRKRSRSRSLSTSPVRRKFRGGNQNSQDIERRNLVDIKSEVLDEKWKPVQRGGQKEPIPLFGESPNFQKNDFGNFPDFKGSVPRMSAVQPKRTDMIYAGMVKEEGRKPPEIQKKRKESVGSARREQFALWKSVVPANEVSGNADERKDKNVKEDIWDTAFGTGEEEPVDKVAMDIFSDFNMDSDYLKGRLPEPKRKNISKNSKATLFTDRKQVVTTSTATVNSTQARQALSTTASHNVPGEAPESSNIFELFAVKAQNEDPMFLGEEKSKELLSQQDDRKMTQQPRSILKRGILKKPTENFDEKPSKKPFEGEVPNRREAVSQETQQSKNEEESHMEQMDGKNKRQEGLGVISSNDLQKIQLIIDNFKEQYGPDWDSSAIEEDLKMVLKRQLISDTAKMPKLERKQQPVGRMANTTLPEPIAAIGQVPGIGSSANSQQVPKSTLFPIKIPEKASTFRSQRDSQVVAAFGRRMKEDEGQRAKEEENLLRSASRMLPPDRQGLMGISRTDHPIRRLESHGIKDYTEEISFQQRAQLQPLKDEVSPIGVKNEERRTAQQNLQVQRPIDVIHSGPEGQHDASYHEGAVHSKWNRKDHIYDIHSERQMMLNRRERGFGGHRDAAEIGLQRKDVGHRFPNQDHSVGRMQEIAMAGPVSDNYRNYLGEPRYQRLKDDARQETIPGLADSWDDRVAREGLQSANLSIHDSRTVENFQRKMQFVEEQRDFELGNLSKDILGARSEERLQKFNNTGQQNESFKSEFMLRELPTEFPERRLGSHGEGIQQREAITRHAAPTKVAQFRQPDHRNTPAVADEFFRYIHKTVAKDAPLGMYYCAVCQLFLANVNERTFHANSDAHKMAATVRDAQQLHVKQYTPAAATLLTPHQVPQVRPILQETRQYQSRGVEGHRGIWPARTAHVAPQQRPFSNTWPRYL